MKGILYILESDETRRFYVGSTSNLKRRLEQHRRGHTHTTKRLGAFHLVFYQEFDTLQRARFLEKRIKSWERKDFIHQIIRDGAIRNID